MEKNGTLYENVIQRQNRQKSIMRKASRCCHCKKYLAEDPNNVGEDEVVMLLKCEKCKIASYCSEDCKLNNWTELHQFLCDKLTKDRRPYTKGTISPYEENDLFDIYLAILEFAFCAQDYKLLCENVDLYAQVVAENPKRPVELSEFHIVLLVSHILVGEDKKARALVDYLSYGQGGKLNSLGDFRELQQIVRMAKEKALEPGPLTTFLMLKNLLWCVLIAIRLNVIEGMKFLLTQYEAYHQKMKRKFRFHPRIITCYTRYILGQDRESFLKELELRENQVEILLMQWQQTVLLVVTDGPGKESSLRKTFIGYAFQGLQEYFLNRPFARNYIINFYNKKIPKSQLRRMTNKNQKTLRDLDETK